MTKKFVLELNYYDFQSRDYKVGQRDYKVGQGLQSGAVHIVTTVSVVSGAALAAGNYIIANTMMFKGCYIECY